MTAFLTIFRRFPEILQNLSEGHTYVAEHFSKISEDYRRFSNTFKEDSKMFRSYTNEFDIIEIIDIFTSEDMENMPPESKM